MGATTESAGTGCTCGRAAPAAQPTSPAVKRRKPCFEFESVIVEVARAPRTM